MSGVLRNTERKISMKKFLRNTFIAVFCILCFDLFEFFISMLLWGSAFINSPLFMWVYAAQYFALVYSAFVIGSEFLAKTKTRFLSITIVPMVIFAILYLLGTCIPYSAPIIFVFPSYLLFSDIIVHFYDDVIIVAVFATLQHLIYCLAMFFGTCRKGNEQTDEGKIMG